MQSSDHKLYSLPVACAALILACSGCPEWLRDALQHHEPEGPPPTAAGHGASAGHGSVPSGDPTKPLLPTASGKCPKIDTGNVSLNGIDAQIWAGAARANQTGALVVYWHATGSSPGEVALMLGNAMDAILDEGGVIIALAGTTGEGEILGSGIWSTGDFALIDQLVACAIAQHPNLDPRRIFTTGCDTGGIAAGALAYQRSNYIAATTLNSGGLVTPLELQDPRRIPAALTVHGSHDADVVIVDFADTSLAYDADLVSRGGFAVDCDHGGGHCAAPAEAKQAQWDFLNAHPYGIDAEPYANGLPSSFPAYCQIIHE